MAALSSQFPGYKLIRMPSGGLRVTCRTCFLVDVSGWRHPFAVLATIPAARRWIADHVHTEFVTEKRAKAAAGRLASERMLKRLGIGPDELANDP